MAEPVEVPAPLGAAARDMLRALSQDESPTVEERERTWQGLASQLDEDEPAANGWRYYAAIVGATVGLAAALVLVVKLALVGVTALADGAREPAMEAPYQGGAESEGGHASTRAPGAIPGPRRRRVVPTAAEPRVAEIVEPPEALPEKPEPATRTVRKPKAPAPSTPSDLQAEIALIAKATSAKGKGQHDAGLAALAEHAKRFPKGALADERRVLEAELVCAAGRHEQARALARRFMKVRSGSALAGRMQRVCASE